MSSVTQASPKCSSWWAWWQMQNPRNQTRLKQKRQSNLWLEGCWFNSTGLASNTDDKFTSVVKQYNLFFISMTQHRADKSILGFKKAYEVGGTSQNGFTFRKCPDFVNRNMCENTHAHTYKEKLCFDFLPLLLHLIMEDFCKAALWQW